MTKRYGVNLVVIRFNDGRVLSYLDLGNRFVIPKNELKEAPRVLGRRS